MKLYIEPTVILIPTRIDDEMLNRLDPDHGRQASTIDGESVYIFPLFFQTINFGADDSFRLPYSLDIRQTKEFNYESSKTKLINLRLGENDGPSVRFTIPGDVVAEGTHDEAAEGGGGRQEHLLRLSGWIDLECVLTVRFHSSLNSDFY